MNFSPTPRQQEIIKNFRSDRYDTLNRLRWDLFLKMGIPIKDQVIFEPGAGIGDQTEWLLSQGAKHVYVSDGRAENAEIIFRRFGYDPRVSIWIGDLENPEFLEIARKGASADLVFLWGCYYHINDDLQEFRIMRALSKIAPVVVFDYLESREDGTTFYGYDNNSTSLSQYAIRPTTPTMIAGLKKAWGHAYLPKVQMDWEDPLAAGTPRRLAVASLEPLNNPNLIEQ